MWSNHSQTTKAPGSLQEACHAQPGVLSTALARTALPQRAVQRYWSSRTPLGHDGALRSADRGHDGALCSAVEAQGALSSAVRAPGAHSSAWLRGGLTQQPLGDLHNGACCRVFFRPVFLQWPMALVESPVKLVSPIEARADFVSAVRQA